MASNEQPVDETVKRGSEGQLPPNPLFTINLFWVDFGLRLLLFACTTTGIVVMVTSKQTEVLSFLFPVTLVAKFNYSPAFIYYVVALSVVCLYSIFTSAVSIYAIFKPFQPNALLLVLVSVDALMVGLAATATGSSASVAYIGLRGNSHVGWMKVCNIYHKFCTHVATSTALALAASILLVLLVFLSTFSLFRRIP